MSKFNGLLDGEYTVTTVGEPKNGGVFNKILLVATVAMGIAGSGLYIYNNTDLLKSVKVKDPELSKVVKAEVENSVNQVEAKQTKYLMIDSPLINDENRERLNKIGNFELPAGLADNQIARTVAQLQFNNKNYFASVVSENEGFRSHLYNDNVGYAVGNGWNASLQSVNYNSLLAQSISKDTIFINKMKGLSGKNSNTSISAEYKQITIEPQRAIQIADLMGEKFEIGVINGIAKAMEKNPSAILKHKETKKSYTVLAKEMYSSLAPNEQAALKYHCYRLGEGGFAKYKEMLSSLVNYGLATKRTAEDSKAIADRLVTKFTLNGVIHDDIRGSLYTSTLFSSIEAYGYLIGKNVAPKNISSLNSQLKANNIDGTAKPGEVKISDPYGEAKAKIEAGDKSIKLNIVADDVLDNIRAMRKENIKKMSAMPQGSFF